MSDEWFYLKRWRAARAAEELSRTRGEVSDVHDKSDEAAAQEHDDNDGTDDPIHRQDHGTAAAPPPSDVR